MKEDEIIALYRTCFPDAAKLIRKMGGTVDDAKDTFHDALIIYLERKAAGKLELRDSAGAYVIGTARILWLRAQRKMDTAILPQEVAEYVEEERSLPGESSLLQYLEAAGRKCMELLVSFYYQGSDLRRIAERFGWSGTRSAAVQKYKCLEKVRSLVKKNNSYAQGVE